MKSNTWGMTKKEIEDFEVRISTLGRKDGEHTIEECRRYACESIAKGITKVEVKRGEIVEIPAGTPFFFFGQVADNPYRERDVPKNYFKWLKNTPFFAGSTISSKRLSHYKGDIFYLYDIEPGSIAHIFPMDSNTNNLKEDERRLTWLPSCWLDLFELENMTSYLGG